MANDRGKLKIEKTFSERLRQYFFAGILLLAPIALTFWVLRFVVNAADSLLAVQHGRFLYFIPERFHPDHLFGIHIPGLGLLVTLLVLPIFGMLARNFLGKRLIVLGENILERVPFVSSVYSSFKQLFGTILDVDRKKSFGKVVLVQFPHPGSWTIAFMTSQSMPAVTKATKQAMVTVFVPTTPSPVNGLLLLVAEDTLVPLNLSAEEAFKYILSFGIIMPETIVSQLTPAK